MPDIIVLNAAETAYEGIKGSSIMEANDIKKCYGKILHGFKANIIKDKVVVSNLDYLKKLSTGNDPYLEKNTVKNIGPQRRDIFNIKCVTDKEQRTVILNENRLKKMYEQ